MCDYVNADIMCAMFVAGVLSGLAERPYIYGMQRRAEPPQKSGSLKRWPGAKFRYSVIAYTETSEIFWTSAQTREISGPCQTREFFGEILGRDPFYPPHDMRVAANGAAVGHLRARRISLFWGSFIA